jgi:hypothetical protein
LDVDWEATMHEAKGKNGQLSYDGSFVTIHGSGFLARTTRGKGEKRIPVTSINGVRWKPAGAMVNGYMALTVAGAIEKQAGFGNQTYRAVKDENSVVFTKKQQPDFEKIRAEIETSIAARTVPTSSPPTTPAADPVAQLAQLSAMHQAGSITDEEFAQMKARLLQGGI